MKQAGLLLLLLCINFSFAQDKETITIPKGIVYNYCDPKVVEKAKKLITQNLSNSDNNKLLQNTLIIGPELWKRYKDNKKIQAIEKGRVEFHVDNLIIEGKMSQDVEDTKIIWEEFKNEVAQDFTIRKANEHELRYYWSVISFDIDEPLLIVETKEHNYILNILKKDLKLMWLDEAPRLKTEKTIAEKGKKETRIEKIKLLNTDEELKENTSLEDIKFILDRTNSIFEELFKTSTKSGRIFVQFELKKDTNEMRYAAKDDIDEELMKEFEKRINNEKFPNSKKDAVKFQIVFIVNSVSDIE